MPSAASVDGELHPVATGSAMSLVEAHQSPQPHILYSGWFCPFVQRSWITLEEKQVPYQYIEINPYHKDPSFLALNPRGLVPTLGCPDPDKPSTDDPASENYARLPLIESNIISEYLDSLPSQRNSLLPDSSFYRAIHKIWIDHISTRIIPAFHRLLQHTPEKPYSLNDAKLELRKHLYTWIAASPSKTGPFWAGEQFSMIDISLAPWAIRLWIFEHFKGVNDLIPSRGDELDEGQDEGIWQRWRDWVAAIEGRKSVKETLSEKKYYLSIYQKYADDKAQSELAKATREGRGVP